MKLSWIPAPPRPGIAGWWDKFIGPGATVFELWLQITVALGAAIAMPIYAISQNLGWSIWQLIIAAILAFDLVGGVITNSTSSAKRWYHRKGQGFSQHFSFIVVHAVQLFLVAWLFRNLDWGFFGSVYVYLLIATLIVLTAPLYIQRPLAMLFYCGSILIGLYFFSPTPGLEWFIPIFFLKLLISHLLKEAPFRPESELNKE